MSSERRLTMLDVAPAVVLGFGGLSVALRSAMELLRGPVLSEKDMSSRQNDDDIPRATVYVSVTPEQAERLRRRGVRVLRHEKTAAYDLGLLDYAGLGGLATLAFLGGYKLADYWYRSQRSKQVLEERERVSNRIRKLLNGVPEPEDVELYHEMVRRGMFEDGEPSLRKTANVLGYLPAAFTVLLGVGAALSALSAYHTSVRTGYDDELARLRKARSRRIPKHDTGANAIEIVPVEVAE